MKDRFAVPSQSGRCSKDAMLRTFAVEEQASTERFGEQTANPLKPQLTAHRHDRKE